MLRFLQKRKFRLVTRWKLALKDNIAVQVPPVAQFPYALIFRAFDEVIRLLKSDPDDPPPASAETLLAALTGAEFPTADHYMELFLSGRDVLGDFVEHDASFAALFAEGDRHSIRASLEHVFRQLVDREMREYARRHPPGVSR